MPSTSFPASRSQALLALEAWLPEASTYGGRRNFVSEELKEVSRLSPAIRHRLLTEYEVAEAAITRHGAQACEKFVQEVYWRRYWKGWLAMRPQIWADYRRELVGLRACPRTVERALALENGEAQVAIMGDFAKELTRTGYLHNHVRMWLAAYWVHIEKLPWQLGADFFMRHLLDGDPASNTLSWRWIAGLHTPGKNYLARRSNLEKFLPAARLKAHSAGLERLEKPVALALQDTSSLALARAGEPEQPPRPEYRTGLWIHEEDLNPESAHELLRDIAPAALLMAADSSSWRLQGFSPLKRDYLTQCFDDTAQRCSRHFDVPCEQTPVTQPLSQSLNEWAMKHQLTQILCLSPPVGPLQDALAKLEAELAQAGVRLAYVSRDRDRELVPLAKAGFFKFWKALKQRGLVPQH